MTEPVLEICNLSKQFGGVKACDNVSLSITENEIHAIIGPNGAGKTTLVSQLSGGLQPDSGMVRFNGRDITSLPAYKRSAIGLARSFQITSLIMSMSVLDNVALGVQARDGHSFKFWKPARSVTKLRDRALEILQQIDLAEKAHSTVSALSHGERRQVEIAVALAGDPILLLLDEPMAGMGASESAKMVEILKRMKGEKTIVLIEHDMDVVFALADRISVLVYGRIIATGSPADIRRNSEVRQAYLGEA
ncbi:ABC transporter, ATP-binding protein 1 (cluster 4, leucine/isoleucine/valine/benzoate) [hydrothermal vent metagenome]|uniref:ABC transporter, ATP-binding protein 1 (Cluster 4, leucine/isoleucine/valine/benzoate) n=1 Tax=hydrothermal vent metagenome TaxID=652676 RepID=A0A3B0RTI6_9ZZZZ